MHDNSRSVFSNLAVLMMVMALACPGLLIGAEVKQDPGAAPESKSTPEPKSTSEAKGKSDAKSTSKSTVGSSPSNGVRTFDAVAVRPVNFLTSVFSAGAFVISLPFAAFDPAMDVTTSRQTLVEYPVDYTFKRPLGDFHYPERPPEVAQPDEEANKPAKR